MVALLKAADVLVRDDPAALAAGWLAAGLLAAAWARPGCLAVAAVAASSNVWLEGSNHTTLILWSGLLVVVLRPEDVSRVAQVLVATVYAFTTSHKLLFGRFLDGGYIEDRFFWDDAPFRLMAFGAVATQLALAVLVLLRLRWAIPLAVLLHAGIVVVMSSTVDHVLRLGGFNGLMVVLVLVATRHGRGNPRRV